MLTAQTAQTDQHVQSILSKAAPTADQVAEVFNDVRESLPQTLANLEVVADMLKRYNKGLEQLLVFLPEIGSIAQTLVASAPGSVLMNLNLSINNPPPCLTGFLPASEWRSPADTSMAPLPSGTYCKIPQDTPANVVRGARNYPCVDVPGKRAATPRECRDNKPYVPLGTNPWYGDPNQLRNCPAPGARCDQPVDPGKVIPAPSVNNGLNPAPADRLPHTTRASQRSAAAARIGHRAVQRAAAQPVHLHAGKPDGDLRPVQRRSGRARRRQVHPRGFAPHRRHRVEGHAGARRLNS